MTAIAPNDVARETPRHQAVLNDLELIGRAVERHRELDLVVQAQNSYGMVLVDSLYPDRPDMAARLSGVLTEEFGDPVRDADEHWAFEVWNLTALSIKLCTERQPRP